MALTMEGGSLRDPPGPNSARQDSSPGPPPFSHSRLRGYASRVEGMLDPKIVLGSSVALTAAGMADPFAPVSGGGGGGGPAGSLLSPRTLAAAQEQPQQYSTPSPPTSQHHARFAAAPASVLAAAAAPGGSAGSGGLHPSRFSPHSTEQLQRPAAPTAAWPSSPGGGGAVAAAAGAAAAAAAASPEGLAAALSQIQALKAEIAGVETVLGYLKGSETCTTTLGRKAHKLPSQEQLRARADALAASRAASRLAGGGGGGSTASVDPLLLAPLRSSVGHGSVAGLGGGGGASPVRAKSAGDAQAAGGPSGTAGTAVFDTLAAETKLGRTWRVPRGPQPVGRGEAVILEAALDEALPAGAITAKYGSGAAVELSFWSGGDVRQDFEMLEMVQREVARQVSVSCAERGRIIEKLADRHSEIFVAVAAAAKAAAEAQRSLIEELAAVRARAVEQASEIASLRSDVASHGAESEDLREQLAEATTAHEHYVWDTEQEVEQLQGQADILAAEVEHLHVRLSEAVAEKDAALSRGLERLEGDLEAVTDERDDLAQRIRFLERQLHKLRTEMNASVDTVTAEVQTDPIDWGPPVEEDVPDDCSDTPSLAEIRARYAAHGYGALTPDERIRLGLPPHMGPEPNKEHKGRKRKRALGHFEGLISSEKPGRVRGLPWTMNAISAIYYDKLHADAVSDREGNPRLRLADFSVDWHMTRFGLRNLAEMHLLDLIASVRQHYRSSVRVRWFGQFTGLVELGDNVDTTPHVSFYLTVLSNLAAPNSLVSLFPDSGGGEAAAAPPEAAGGGGGGGGTPPVALKAAALPEATRAVFRYLGEPEAAAGFMARAVDPLTDPVNQLVPLDPLVALFMAEYQKRWERNAAHLQALFRAGDYDDDGLVGYDEFVAIVRQLIPDPLGERMATKMYGDAVRRLPEGQSLVDSDTFLAVARAYGWDRWRIDAGAPTSTSTATSALSGSGGSLPKPLPSQWSLASAVSVPLSTSAGGAPLPPAFSTGGAGGGGGVLRNPFAVAASANSLRTMAAAAAAAAAPPPPPSSQSYNRSVSNLRKEESVVGLSEHDRALMRVLDGALEGLDPPLEEQVAALLERLRAGLAAAQTQAAAAAAAVAALPGLDLGPSHRELTQAIAADSALLSKLEGQFEHFRAVYDERTNPAAAWLAFRMLLASLAAAMQGPRARNTSRSRPGSAKGSVGWGVPRSVMRLTVPSLPFRAGSGSRALAGTSSSGGGAAAAAAVAHGSRGSPGAAAASGGGGLGFGLGLIAAPSSGSLQQILGGPSAGLMGSAGGGGGGFDGGVGLAAGSMASPLRSPSPLQRSSNSRSPPPAPPPGRGRSPDLPGRPTGLAQMIQGSIGGTPAGVGPGTPGGGGGSFADRQSASAVVIPSPTAPVPLHRVPLPATLAGRGSALASSAGAAGGGSGVSTPSKRGVVFSLGGQPQPAAAAPPPPPGAPGAAAPQAPYPAATPAVEAAAAQPAAMAAAAAAAAPEIALSPRSRGLQGGQRAAAEAAAEAPGVRGGADGAPMAGAGGAGEGGPATATAAAAAVEPQLALQQAAAAE
ncbi:hypothetical protein PLESTB_000590300 [Pleodorina starrii]|uniref:EF-hand domain-containing protein n=1 Tax=Pleodorina starrii TaxID=330485 RepID=A0A9W6F0T7_9CHLO|nr:hypothetical protein PLESTM_000763500 [Pleodorina starrii]GLC52167.1 hypothetical protein PLESTB_000590300 [Pleodorina starrii]GLC75794.1 hypothetical protein PLESTF_001688100 [Pleodorina starrii]